jgi:hypothetical protein
VEKAAEVSWFLFPLAVYAMVRCQWPSVTREHTLAFHRGSAVQQGQDTGVYVISITHLAVLEHRISCPKFVCCSDYHICESRKGSGQSTSFI